MPFARQCAYAECASSFVSNRARSKFCSIKCANQSRRIWEIQKDGTKKGFAKYQRARRYGLTRTEYDTLIETYEGKPCPICTVRPAVVIEHDHTTGQVRGMTCTSCNNGLAAFGDDEAGLLRALDYIRGTCVGIQKAEGNRL